MSPVSLSDLAAFCLSNAEKATSFPERVAWLAFARSIVTQRFRMERSQELATALIQTVGPYVGWVIQQRAVRPPVDPLTTN